MTAIITDEFDLHVSPDHATGTVTLSFHAIEAGAPVNPEEPAGPHYHQTNTNLLLSTLTIPPTGENIEDLASTWMDVSEGADHPLIADHTIPPFLIPYIKIGIHNCLRQQAANQLANGTPYLTG